MLLIRTAGNAHSAFSGAPELPPRKCAQTCAQTCALDAPRLHPPAAQRLSSLRSATLCALPFPRFPGSGLGALAPLHARPLRVNGSSAQSAAAVGGAARLLTSAAFAPGGSSIAGGSSSVAEAGGGGGGAAESGQQGGERGERGDRGKGEERGKKLERGTRGEREDRGSLQAGQSRDKPNRHWRRLCYYHTQGKCALSEDKDHLKKVSHELPDLTVRAGQLKKVRKQPFEYFLVLDLEGREEILEFPVVLLCSKTLRVVSHFHRFVRPDLMTVERQAEYIRGKYGPWGLARVWHDTAIPFAQVLSEFEQWLDQHNLLDHGGDSSSSSSSNGSSNSDSGGIAQQCTEGLVAEEEEEEADGQEEGEDEWNESEEQGDSGGMVGASAAQTTAAAVHPTAAAAAADSPLGHGPGLRSAIVVTCGNWDVKSKVVEQCRDSHLPLPTYFLQWCNLKDVYLNFYKRKASGMMPMMRGLQLAPIGTHHVGLDDALNITRVLQRMLSHGALIRTSARRTGPGPSDVEYMFRRRVK